MNPLIVVVPKLAPLADQPSAPVVVLVKVEHLETTALWQSYFDGMIDLEQFKEWCNDKD